MAITNTPTPAMAYAFDLIDAHVMDHPEYDQAVELHFVGIASEYDEASKDWDAHGMDPMTVEDWFAASDPAPDYDRFARAHAELTGWTPPRARADRFRLDNPLRAR